MSENAILIFPMANLSSIPALGLLSGLTGAAGIRSVAAEGARPVRRLTGRFGASDRADLAEPPGLPAESRCRFKLRTIRAGGGSGGINAIAPFGCGRASGSGSRQTIDICRAIIAAWVRFLAFSLAQIARMCILTTTSVIPSILAISLLVMPLGNLRRMDLSRSVRL